MSWDNMGGQKGRANVFSVAKVPTQKTGFLIKKRGGNGCPSLKCEKSLNRNQQFGRRADFQKVPPKTFIFLVNMSWGNMGGQKGRANVSS